MRMKIERRKKKTIKIPENFRTEIENKGGANIALVTHQRLYEAYVKKGPNCRLVVPKRLVVRRNRFLTDKEEKLLGERDANGHMNNSINDVPLLDPGLKWRSVSLKKWEWNGGGKRSNLTYTLNGDGWMKIVEENGLEAGDAVQLWCFRVGHKLQFALCKVKEEYDEALVSCILGY